MGILMATQQMPTVLTRLAATTARINVTGRLSRVQPMRYAEALD